MALPAPATLIDSATPRLAGRSLGVAVNGRRLVNALDFEARGGEFVAILGRNGVGKTLTLHTLAGLRTPSAGTVELDSRGLAVLSMTA